MQPETGHPAPALPPAIEAIELLVRKWNPPHRLPRPITLAGGKKFELPIGFERLPTAGSYLRGLSVGNM